jgi:hypothetical protein
MPFHIIPFPTGSAIQVYGSNNRANTSSGWDPSWECSIDNISVNPTDPFPYFENNWLFCQKLDLNDGPHELTVNVTSTSNQTFWFDFIRYAPSANVFEGANYVLVDNQDPAILYGSGWGPLGSTANMTGTLGAEFRFNFTGV